MPLPSRRLLLAARHGGWPAWRLGAVVGPCARVLGANPWQRRICWAKGRCSGPALATQRRRARPGEIGCGCLQAGKGCQFDKPAVTCREAKYESLDKQPVTRQARGRQSVLVWTSQQRAAVSSSKCAVSEQAKRHAWEVLQGCVDGTFRHLERALARQHGVEHNACRQMVGVTYLQAVISNEAEQ